MAWSFRYDDGACFAECVFSGRTSVRDIRNITARSIALQKEAGVLCYLINARDTEFDVTHGDTYQLPARVYPEGKVDKRTRIAVVRPRSASASAIVDFYVLACTNRYWKAQAFRNRSDAIEWLQGK